MKYKKAHEICFYSLIINVKVLNYENTDSSQIFLNIFRNNSSKASGGVLDQLMDANEWQKTSSICFHQPIHQNHLDVSQKHKQSCNIEAKKTGSVEKECEKVSS